MLRFKALRLPCTPMYMYCVEPLRMQNFQALSCPKKPPKKTFKKLSIVHKIVHPCACYHAYPFPAPWPCPAPPSCPCSCSLRLAAPCAPRWRKGAPATGTARSTATVLQPKLRFSARTRSLPACAHPPGLGRHATCSMSSPRPQAALRSSRTPPPCRRGAAACCHGRTAASTSSLPRWPTAVGWCSGRQTRGSPTP